MSGAISFLAIYLHGVDRESFIYSFIYFCFTKFHQIHAAVLDSFPSIDGRTDALKKYGQTEKIFMGLTGDMDVAFT